MAYPIILIHKGDSPYLAYAIAQAKSSNPESRVILLGDGSNSYYLGVEHHYYERYFSEASTFKDLYKYEFFPNYQYPWMLFCHQKYFALRDFCRIHGIKKYVLIDSDVMIYEDITPYFKLNENASITVFHPDSKLIHAGTWFAIIQDDSIIDELCKINKILYSDSGRGTRAQLNCKFYWDMTGPFLLMKKNPEKCSTQIKKFTRENMKETKEN
jgi:hypothetical protein